jgi:hypothetical protein
VRIMRSQIIGHLYRPSPPRPSSGIERPIRRGSARTPNCIVSRGIKPLPSCMKRLGADSAMSVDIDQCVYAQPADMGGTV